jgi:hypothetical protein
MLRSGSAGAMIMVPTQRARSVRQEKKGETCKIFLETKALEEEI